MTQPLDPIFSEFLSYLRDFQVRFVIVGAHALAVHGVSRWTGDLDVLVEPTADNADRLSRVFGAFGFPKLAAAAPTQMAEPDRMARLGRVPLRIDVLTSLSGVEWEDAWRGHVEVELDGETHAFLGLEDYVTTKRAAGRTKDLQDLELLREAGVPIPD